MISNRLNFNFDKFFEEEIDKPNIGDGKYVRTHVYLWIMN